MKNCLREEHLDIEELIENKSRYNTLKIRSSRIVNVKREEEEEGPQEKERKY